MADEIDYFLAAFLRVAFFLVAFFFVAAFLVAFFVAFRLVAFFRAAITGFPPLSIARFVPVMPTRRTGRGSFRPGLSPRRGPSSHLGHSHLGRPSATSRDPLDWPLLSEAPVLRNLVRSLLGCGPYRDHAQAT